MGSYLGPGARRHLLGFEDTRVLPPPGSPMGPLDEFALTDHDANWRDDLRAARDLGADGIRYGVKWPDVHPAPGGFDFADLDERIAFAHEELGLQVVADLVHYGTPTWLADSFADPGYPSAVADYTAAFAERYRGAVTHLTPLNEPMTTASFCGLRGVWPPALTGWSGWTTVMLNIVEGVQAQIAAARAVDPEIVVVHVEAASVYRTDDPTLAGEVGALTERALLPTDLLLGLVGPDHPQLPFLVQHGADPARLDRIRSAGVGTGVDVLGLNYYPDLSPRTLYRGADGVAQRALNDWTSGLRACVRTFAARWALPLVITETSIEGDPATRRAWLEDSLDEVERLRAEGADLRGYTWWPVLDFVDWSWASGGVNVEEFDVPDELVAARVGAPGATRDRTPYLRRMGLVELEEPRDGGALLRRPTVAAQRFRELTADASALLGMRGADA